MSSSCDAVNTHTHAYLISRFPGAFVSQNSTPETLHPNPFAKPYNRKVLVFVALALLPSFVAVSENRGF